MFERYTEKARRVIFFARFEASAFGSPYIETEHMLLGLLREDKAIARRVIPDLSAERIRQEIEKATIIRPPTSTSVDLPLSNECKRVLTYAAEEAEGLSHKHIGTEHLLLGLMCEENSSAARLLREHGVTLEATRSMMREAGVVPDTGQISERTGFGGGGGGRIHPETRVVMRRSIVFHNEADDADLGETFAIDVPRVGDEVVIRESRTRVTRVVYHYEDAKYVIEGKEVDLKPEKIIVYVQPL